MDTNGLPETNGRSGAGQHATPLQPVQLANERLRALQLAHDCLMIISDTYRRTPPNPTRQIIEAALAGVTP